MVIDLDQRVPLRIAKAAPKWFVAPQPKAAPAHRAKSASSSSSSSSSEASLRSFCVLATMAEHLMHDPILIHTYVTAAVRWRRTAHVLLANPTVPMALPVMLLHLLTRIQAWFLACTSARSRAVPGLDTSQWCTSFLLMHKHSQCPVGIACCSTAETPQSGKSTLHATHEAASAIRTANDALTSIQTQRDLLY